MKAVAPGYEYHAYDPGERRKLIRRMADRVKAIENVVDRGL